MSTDAFTPPDSLVRNWVLEYGGNIDADTAIIPLTGLRDMLTFLAKFAAKACQAANEALDEDDQKATATPRSADDINPEALTSLAEAAEILIAMRDAFKSAAGDEWKPLVKKTEEALEEIRQAAIISCGRQTF